MPPSARPMPKSVCIIGAGPSGLVAAKTLSHHHHALSLPTPIFTTTVYDARASLGGLWPSSRTSTSRPIHPDMTANLSRHTVQFSDLAWDDALPVFPRAWMVGEYLARYAKTYLEGNENVEMRLGRRVCSARRRAGGGWVVESKAAGEGRWTEGERDEREFDYLVVASGYFGEKRVPEWARDVRDGERKIPVLHSTEFRDLKGLIGDDNPGRKILVVGGQMSGVEIATSVASELSSAAHSPEPSPIAKPEEYTVHHLADRHAWVFPLFTTPTPEKKNPIFLPSDINTCNLSRRPRPLSNLRGGLVSEDAARAAHERIQASLGTDQSEFHPLMRLTDPSAPPYVAISQLYPSLVRSGQITLSRGRLSSPEEIPAKTGIPLSDIAAVVLATGFDPSPSVSYLSPDILETIGHAPEFPDLTPALSFHGTHHPSVPDLGFAGFYRGPYWGVSEMQSRFLAHLWTPQDIAPRSEALAKALAEDRSVEELLSMRGNPRASQFPMGDYPYLMQEFARALDLSLSPPPPSPDPEMPLDVLTPARYTYPSQSAADVATSLSQTQDCAAQCLTSPRFLAAAAFRNLLGKWSLRREIKSALPSHPSGTFTGTATFHLRRKTRDGLKCLSPSPPNPAPNTTNPSPPDENEGFDGLTEGWEYLYEENGTFTTPTFSFPASRRYVYRYDESSDALSAWFTRVDEPLRADYLFHDVEFLPREPGSDDAAVRARAGHLCVDDYYSVGYEFEFRGVEMGRWSLGYDVRGPKKEYSLHGVYTRTRDS